MEAFEELEHILVRREIRRQGLSLTAPGLRRFRPRARWRLRRWRRRGCLCRAGPGTAQGEEQAVSAGVAVVELQQALQRKYQVPVIEGVTAAVSIMQGLARLPLTTSRKNTYARPLHKEYSGLFKDFTP